MTNITYAKAINTNWKKNICNYWKNRY